MTDSSPSTPSSASARLKKTFVRTSIPAALGIPIAVVGGLAMPAQSRVNGALAGYLQDGLSAALVSFGVGLALMIVITALTKAGRSGLRRVIPVVRSGELPWWYLLAGFIGGYFVLTQGLTVGLLGIALFTVASVAGQTVGALFVDRMGLSPAGKKAITLIRVLGVVLTICSVLLAVSPKLMQSAHVALWPLLLPLSAGVLMAFQQALNGTATVHYKTPIITTLLNFASGFVILGVIWVIKTLSSGFTHPLPHVWWMYLGGPLGCFFIAVSAVLVKHLGVLLTGLGLIAGQLLGSLFFDLWLPTAGSVVNALTVGGTLLTLVAIVIASLPWPGAVNPFRRR